MDSADLLLRQEICFKGPGAIRSWICLIIKRIRKVGESAKTFLKKTNPRMRRSEQQRDQRKTTRKAAY